MRGGKTKKAAKSKASTRSVMGRLMPPVDITDAGNLNELDSRIAAGPLTLVLVYADWCGHCQRFKPMMSKLENEAGRSIQTARIRDDVFPQSSLSGEKLSGYPSLMLVDKNGKSKMFKNAEGETTNTIPEYTDMNKMMTIVRNAGKPEGQSISLGEPVSPEVISSPTVAPNVAVNTPKSIVADRLSPSQVNSLNKTMAASNNATLREATKPLGSGSGSSSQQGGFSGGLFSQLMSASQRLAPAAALFLGAEVVKRKSKSRKTRRRSGKN
jgi:thiol-disulfide isomerase/thioredoxin